MKITNSEKVLSWVIAIILGAFGSGLWESILKPGFLLFSNAVISFAFSTFEHYQIALYADIALGSYDRTGPTLLTLFGGFVAGGFILIPLLKQHEVVEHKNSQENKRFFVSVIGVLIATAIFISVASLAFVDKKVNELELAFRTATPYLTLQQRDSIRSEFGLITSEREYNAIFQTLIKIIKKHRSKLPRHLQYYGREAKKQLKKEEKLKN